MKKTLVSLLLCLTSVSAFAGGTTYAVSALNPRLISVMVTNTVGVSNIIAQAVSTNSVGVNTNYNVAGIVYSNYSSTIPGNGLATGSTYQTFKDGANGPTIVTNGASNSGFYSTNDTTVFFSDVSLPCNALGSPLTNCAIVLDYQPTASAAAFTNMTLTLAPIYYKDPVTQSLNTPSVGVETVNTVTYVWGVTGSSTARAVVSKPLASIIPSAQWDGMIGFRVLSIITTNTLGSYNLYGVRVTGFTP